MIYTHPDRVTPVVQTDPIVDAVRAKLHERSQVGIKKYGTMMTRQDLTDEQWLQHLQEELLDAAVYIQRLLTSIKVLQEKTEQ